MQESHNNSNKSKDIFRVANSKENLKERAIRGAGAMLFSSTTLFVITFISQIFLARLLSPTDFGLVAMVLTVHSFLQIIRNLGLVDATVQHEKIDHDLISTIFWINVVFGILLSVAFIAVSPLVAMFFKEPRLKLIIVFISIDYIFGGICAQHRALIRRSLHMYHWAAIDIVTAIVSFGIAIYLAFLGWGYWALVARWVVRSPVQAIMAWILCPWRPGRPSRVDGISDMLKFGTTLVTSFFVEYVMGNIEKILIGRSLGAQLLGYYNRAFNLYEAPTGQLATPVSGVAISTLSKINKEPERYRSYFLKAFRVLSTIGFPVGFLLALIGKDIIIMLFGEKWAIAGDIFSILGLAIGLQILYETNTWIHVSLARNERRIKWSIFASLFTIACYLYGIKFGVKGVAAARVFSLYLLILPSLWYAGRPIEIRITRVINSIWKIYISALVSAITCWYFASYSGFFSTIYIELHVALRIVGISIVYFSMYLVALILLHGNFKVILELVDVLKEMIKK